MRKTITPPPRRPGPAVAPPAVLPPQWDPADVTALQALQRGEADPAQQKRALAWVIEQAAGTYELSFRPGASDGDRETAFAEGRRFVGLQMVKLLRLNLSAFRKANNA